MIAKKFRVPNDVFRKRPSTQISSEYFQVKVFPNDCGHSRFSAVVGIKVDKRSVQRHFWKRFILSNAAKQKNSEIDFVIIAKTALNKISKEEAARELESIFENLKNK